MDFRYDLQHERVKHLDLTQFTRVESGTTVGETINKMRSENRNCALVTQGNELVGIFTDRDVLRKVVSVPEAWEKPVDELMTTSPFTVTEEDEAETAIMLMNARRFRNVPVVDAEGNIAGNLTHYGLIKYFADQFPESLYNLPPEPGKIDSDRVGG